MKRTPALSILVAPLLLGATGCNASSSITTSSAPHVHEWGDWERDEEGHWRYCLTCGKDEYGEHEGGLCDVCACFRVLALGFLEGGDGAHGDFAKECNDFFPRIGKKEGFLYDFSTDFGLVNEDNLANYDALMFLNNYPYSNEQRQAFQNYMENGGGWIGFHVSAFTTESSSWDWYFNTFLGSGNFRTNTWNPTPELLKAESLTHPALAHVPETFMSSPNEWYGWEKDLRENEDIDILLSLDDSTFPVGDRKGEIWYNESGEDYYPVAWANRNYNMVYMNMGHNLMPYNDFAKTSKTFSKEHMNQFVLDALKAVARRD
ncbi:MAG: ThuA domain-containing protein [Bacilli bacterium]|nr:ThuA domain-containing protein [Bacilli bacterium]